MNLRLVFHLSVHYRSEPVSGSVIKHTSTMSDTHKDCGAAIRLVKVLRLIIADRTRQMHGVEHELKSVQTMLDESIARECVLLTQLEVVASDANKHFHMANTNEELVNSLVKSNQDLWEVNKTLRTTPYSDELSEEAV
jgi:hypothetical protein